MYYVDVNKYAFTLLYNYNILKAGTFNATGIFEPTKFLPI